MGDDGIALKSKAVPWLPRMHRHPSAGGFGGYTGWGTAWFNAPVEDLIGKAGAFAVEVVGVIGGTAHVQITGDGFIGNCSTGESAPAEVLAPAGVVSSRVDGIRSGELT